MPMPYQRLRSCREVIFAARGSSIDSFNLGDGSLLSTWTFPLDSNTSKSSNGKVSLKVANQKSEPSVDTSLDSSPPAKRRRLSEAGEGTLDQASNGDSEVNVEKNGPKKGNKRSEAVVSGLDTPAVSALTTTADGRHVIAVTGEDKSIRVFENSVDGEGMHIITQLSERTMPKRPCAVAVTSDNSTIISADKFGDVYSLPLLVSSPPATDITTKAPAPESLHTKPFVSAANHLTVHSQRNLKALENQRNQSNKPPEKTQPTFEHKLLLGHVSMLTDLALVTAAGGRHYILTADRDEHIRVSRGIPQAFIVEGFCLGHTDFISRLCVPKERTDVLISGGGDDELLVWEWKAGSLIAREDLRSRVEILLRQLHRVDGNDDTLDPFQVTVSSITHVRVPGSDGPDDLIVVSCEGIPALFTFILATSSQLIFAQTLRLLGNVLDVAETASGLVVSIDTIHKPASTTERRDAAAETVAALQDFKFHNQKLVASSTMFQIPEDAKESRQLNTLLYTLEQLRKRDDGREEA